MKLLTFLLLIFTELIVVFYWHVDNMFLDLDFFFVFLFIFGIRVWTWTAFSDKKQKKNFSFFFFLLFGWSEATKQVYVVHASFVVVTEKVSIGFDLFHSRFFQV